MSTLEYMVQAVSRWDNACQLVDWVMQCQDNAMLDREPRGMVIPMDRLGGGRPARLR